MVREIFGKHPEKKSFENLVQDTGFDINLGDMITISASGMVSRDFTGTLVGTYGNETFDIISSDGTSTFCCMETRYINNLLLVELVCQIGVILLIVSS